MRHLAAVFFMLVLLSAPALALEGYDSTYNDDVEIEGGVNIAEGGVLKVYDYDDGSVHEVEVVSIHRSTDVLQVEVFDFEDGDFRVIEVDAQTAGALVAR